MITILNRDFTHPADGWYPIEHKGYFAGIADDGRKIVQVIDDKAVTSIVNRFNSAAGAGKLPHGSEMLIDREHFRHHRDLAGQKDMDSLAYGWVKELRVAPDGSGYEMKNRWTGSGQKSVDTGEYRFLSTEYDETNPGDVWEPVNPADVPLEIRNKYKGWEFMRPLQLTGLSLTNDNNNKGAKPLTVLNRNTFAGAGAPADSKQLTIGIKMKSVCTALGLSPDAAEDVVLAEVTKLKNRGDITVADLTTLRNRETALGTENATLLGDQCEALMDAHGLKADAPARATLKPVLVGLKNRADRVSFLSECVAKPQAPAGPHTTLRNRDTKSPGAAANSEPDAQATAITIKNRAIELQGKGMKFSDAFATATREHHAAQAK